MHGIVSVRRSQQFNCMLVLSAQVTLLASGLLVYHGPTEDLIPWCSGQLGYPYDPLLHGVASDWALDLVAIGFNKPEVRPEPQHAWYVRCDSIAIGAAILYECALRACPCCSVTDCQC